MAACWSDGGFLHGSPAFSDDYGNYTGVPVLNLVNLVGGISPGGTVVATSGADGYQTTYTYNQVVNGLGWSQEVYPAGHGAVATTVPLILVLAYLWNGSALSTYVSGGSGVGPLRTVTISSSGYDISAGAPWNKGVTTIQVFNPPPAVPEFGLGVGAQAGTALAMALGVVALVAVKRRWAVSSS